jgi:serine/arginine repetitive matrix protein 1
MIKFEDDVVVEYVFGMLEDKDTPVSHLSCLFKPDLMLISGQMPDPRKMQVNLLGFMDKYGAAHFMETLWNLLISAQNTVGGVPAEVCGPSLPYPLLHEGCGG